MKGKFRSAKVVIALFAALVSIGAAAQESTPQSSRFTTYTTPSVTVRVYWSTQQEVEQRCGKDAAGCASPVTMQKSYAEIWAQKPAGWEDDDLRQPSPAARAQA